MFVFNKDRNDYEQVAPYIGDYALVRQEIIDSTGRHFVYNDELIDRIPAIANKQKRGPSVGSHEDVAIYMLQTLFRFWELEARLIDFRAEGYEEITSILEPTKFAHIVLYPTESMQGEYATYHDARLLPHEGNNRPYAILPRGRRTNGKLVGARSVLALSYETRAERATAA